MTLIYTLQETMTKTIFRFSFASLAVLVLCNTPVQAQKTPYDWALIRLDYIRQEKVDQLRRFTEKLHDIAQKAATDQKIIAFFEVNRQYLHVSRTAAPPAALIRQVEEIRKEFDQYYIANYFAFYDILFLDMEGTAVYSIRKQVDTGLDLANPGQAIGKLGKVLARSPHKEVFIDFYEYSPSAEPAAFFVEPVFHEGVQEGWIVLQWAINKLNSIFASTPELGRTGETFLVNQDGFMLTESYLKGDSTILRQHLDNRNITAKFKEGTGHRLITDYRGARAWSSFAVFEFLNTKWLVVAKIDKDEITTDHYRDHKKYYRDRLLNYLEKSPALKTGTASPRARSSASYRVDMDEFAKATHGEQLETWGVKTCTALIATVPEKFCYLAHISPLDRIYEGSGTNLLEQIIKKINHFDIYPYERREVVFVAAAPHLDSIPNIIDLLIDNGFFLSQIRIAYHPLAESVAVYTDYQHNRSFFEWRLETQTAQTVFIQTEQTVNAGEVIAAVMDSR